MNTRISEKHVIPVTGPLALESFSPHRSSPRMKKYLLSKKEQKRRSKDLKAARIRIQQRLSEKKKASKTEISIRLPRYDEIFFAGCEWLDSPAGERMGSGLAGRLRKRQRKNLGGVMDELDKQEKRIMAILGTKKYDVTPATLKKYLKYLKKHVEFPCQLTGIEDFEWEEFYVFGPGSQREYKKLKETQPSYKDKFNLIEFVDNLDDDDWESGIFVVVRRESDRKKFFLPLADLKATNKKSQNYQLLDDYSVWFVNNR